MAISDIVMQCINAKDKKSPISHIVSPSSLFHPQNAVFNEPTDEMVVVKDIEMFR